MEDVRLFYRCCRSVCRWTGVLLFKIRYHGLHNVPRTGGVLLVSNHQSFLDPALEGMALPREVNFMARDTLFASKRFGWLIKSLNAFPVQRNTADIGAIKEALRRLKSGCAMVLYPEGTRTKTGQIGPMLPGLTALAKKAKVPIVPTLIDGAFQAWPRKSILPRPGSIIIEYGPPITPADYAELTAEELIEQVRNRLIAMQQKWHSRLPERRIK